jgi:hypothetical protein
MTAEPIVLINLLILLISVWAAMAVNYKYLQPALLNKKRFAIYELRDRLAILAMRGVIDEDSEEYVTLINLINGVLCSTKSFRITEFLNMHAAIYLNAEVIKHIDSILIKIHKKDMPKAYKEIVSSFFNLARGIYRHKTRGLRPILRGILLPISVIAQVIGGAKAIKIGIANQLEKLTSTETTMDANIARLASL